MFLSLGRAFGRLCLLSAIIVVYAATVQDNAFEDGLLGNGCSRCLGLTLKLIVFDARPSVISWWDRLVACQCLFLMYVFFYVNVVQLTTSLDVVVGGRLGVNFFPAYSNS